MSRFKIRRSKFTTHDPEFRVERSEFGVEGLKHCGFKVGRSGLRFQSADFRLGFGDSRLRVDSSGFKVSGSEFMVQISDFRVQGGGLGSQGLTSLDASYHLRAPKITGDETTPLLFKANQNLSLRMQRVDPFSMFVNMEAGDTKELSHMHDILTSVVLRISRTHATESKARPSRTIRASSPSFFLFFFFLLGVFSLRVFFVVYFSVGFFHGVIFMCDFVECFCWVFLLGVFLKRGVFFLQVSACVFFSFLFFFFFVVFFFVSFEFFLWRDSLFMGEVFFSEFGCVFKCVPVVIVFFFSFGCPG